jgi:hypothetical protein
MNLLSKTSWADYDDETDELLLVQKDNTKVSEKILIQEDNTQVKEDTKDQEDTNYEFIIEHKQELFQKVVKKSNKKINIPVVYELKEFIQCLNSKQKPNIDFMIDISAHCNNTYKGTLCKNIKKCNKIHIQRCIKGDECKNKKCSYIHKCDMPDEKSKYNFDKTMNTYNKIKPNKKVLKD